MNILALETSTELGSCALWQNGVVLERFCPVGQSHSETLLPLLSAMLSEAGLSVAQLDGIAFGVGPGAFTGLRVACGVAQGLAVAHGIPLFPVVSLEAMAEAMGAEKVVSLLDARMGEVYAACYERSEGGFRLNGQILVSSPAEVVLPDGAAWLACGNAISAYPVLLQRLVDAGITFDSTVLPNAASLARIAAPRVGRGEGIDAALAAPLYIRDKVAKTVAERLSEGGRA